MELEKIRTTKVSELIPQRILTHGREGAARRIMIMENGNRYAFSDFYEFNGAKAAKIKSITSNVVKLEP